MTNEKYTEKQEEVDCPYCKAAKITVTGAGISLINPPFNILLCL